jgi:hypothetical protein
MNFDDKRNHEAMKLMQGTERKDNIRADAYRQQGGQSRPRRVAAAAVFCMFSGAKSG